MSTGGRSRGPTVAGRRFRRHEMNLDDGGRLILETDGAIRHLAADGTLVESWAVDAPGWSDRALRFGVVTGAPTVAPHRMAETPGKIHP